MLPGQKALGHDVDSPEDISVEQVLVVATHRHRRSLYTPCSPTGDAYHGFNFMMIPRILISVVPIRSGIFSPTVSTRRQHTRRSRLSLVIEKFSLLASKQGCRSHLRIMKLPCDRNVLVKSYKYPPVPHRISSHHHKSPS